MYTYCIYLTSTRCSTILVVQCGTFRETFTSVIWCSPLTNLEIWIGLHVFDCSYMGKETFQGARYAENNYYMKRTLVGTCTGVDKLMNVNYYWSLLAVIYDMRRSLLPCRILRHGWQSGIAVVLFLARQRHGARTRLLAVWNYVVTCFMTFSSLPYRLTSSLTEGLPRMQVRYSVRVIRQS